MKFDISLEATLDEETGKLSASLKGDLPDELLTGFGKLASAVADAANKRTAKEEKTS